jgi:hypothetical protein
MVDGDVAEVVQQPAGPVAAVDGLNQLGMVLEVGRGDLGDQLAGVGQQRTQERQVGRYTANPELRQSSSCPTRRPGRSRPRAVTLASNESK